MTQGICEESQVSKVRSEAESESGIHWKREGDRRALGLGPAFTLPESAWHVCVCVLCGWCVYFVQMHGVCTHVHVCCVHVWSVCTCMQMGVCTCTHLYAEVKNAFQHTVETESGWLGGQEW